MKHACQHASALPVVHSSEAQQVRSLHRQERPRSRPDICCRRGRINSKADDRDVAVGEAKTAENELRFGFGVAGHHIGAGEHRVHHRKGERWLPVCGR